MGFVAADELMRVIMHGIADADTGGDNPGALAGCKLGLYTNNPSLTPETAVSDFDEPTWTGYARTTVTGIAGASRDPDGNWFVYGPPVNFPFDPAGGPVTVNGAFLVSADTPPRLLGATLFDTPRTLSISGDSVFVEVELALSPNAFPYGPSTD
jgi:hypothetical protein